MIHQQSKSENLHRAFYSLVQYCPDLSRLEVANVGVVVFCPELDFLGSEMTQNHTRINQMFGRGQRDLKRLKIVKAGLQEKLAASASQTSLEHLNQLAALHVNTIRMSQFMPCRVSSDPRSDLQCMFNELVEDTTVVPPLSKPAALRKKLDEQFSAPRVNNRIKREIKVTIPVLNREEEIPYGYQNGRFNLITPVVFPKGKTRLEDRSAKYAVEGRSLYQHENSEFGKMQLLVVGQFDDGDEGAVATAKRILETHKVRLFQQADLHQLVDEIATQGHIIE
jgi:hypothetical protein